MTANKKFTCVQITMYLVKHSNKTYTKSVDCVHVLTICVVIYMYDTPATWTIHRDNINSDAPTNR